MILHGHNSPAGECHLRGDVHSIGDAGTRARGRGEVRYIVEKRKKVKINRSKKLISFNETAQTSAIFLPIRTDLPITNTFLSGLLESLNRGH